MNIPKILFYKYGSCGLIRKLIRQYSISYEKKLFKNSTWSIIQYTGGCDLQQATHPDVLYDAEEKLYVMTVSDYPFGIEKYENSFVYQSKDGIHFENVLKDAVEAYQGNGKSHFSDGELVHDASGYHVYYRLCERDSDFRDILYMQSSGDLKNWGDRKCVVNVPGDKCLSPAILLQNGKYCVYYVQLHEKGSSFHRSICDKNTLDDFCETAEEMKILNMPENYMLWHINVSQLDDCLIGLMTLSRGHGGADAVLYGAVSEDDGKTWRINQKINLEVDEKKIKKVYRSALVRVKDTVYLYVSVCTTNDLWFVVRKEYEYVEVQ